MNRDFLFAIAEDEEREGSIPKTDILAGIHSDDTELAGAIYDIVTIDRETRGQTGRSRVFSGPAQDGILMAT